MAYIIASSRALRSLRLHGFYKHYFSTCCSYRQETERNESVSHESIKQGDKDSVNRFKWKRTPGVRDSKAQKHDKNKSLRPCAIWLSKTGQVPNLQSIIEQLPQPKERHQTYLDTAVFLVTPKFAHLFDPGSNFHAEIVNTIWSDQWFRDESKKRLSSIVAIVDALPVLPSQPTPYDEIRGAEGFSLLLTSRPALKDEVLIKTQSGRDSDDTSAGSISPVVTLTTSFKNRTEYKFQSPSVKNLLGDEPKRQVAIAYSAPVANTLFVNGRKHTMFQHWWARRGENLTKLVSDGDVEYLSHISIPIYDPKADPSFPASLSTNLVALTKPTKIVSSMGNILRQVEVNGTPTSASQELERIIPDIVKTKQQVLTTGEIRVFALIYPDLPENKEYDISGAEDPEISWGNLLQIKNTARSRLQRTLTIGDGRLFRVTSGGAGWGKHAGLLSLEPMVQLNQISELSSLASFLPGFEIEDAVDESMIPEKKLLPEGHKVQFLAAWFDSRGKEMRAVNVRHHKKSMWLAKSYWEAQRVQSMCIGTTIMNETTENASGSGLNDLMEAYDYMEFYPNKFGFLTTGAMSISTKAKLSMGQDAHTETDIIAGPGEKIVHSTLVDVPNCAVRSMARGVQLEEYPLSRKREKYKKQINEKPGEAEENPRKPRVRYLTSGFSIRYFGEDHPHMSNIPPHKKESERRREELEEHMEAQKARMGPERERRHRPEKTVEEVGGQRHNEKNAIDDLLTGLS